MNRFLLFIVTLIIIILFFNIGQAQIYSNMTNEQFIIRTTRAILVNRMSIINSCLFRNLDLDIAKKMLKEIETDILVEDDIRYLNYIRESPTDFEYVNDLKILKVYNINSNLEEISFVTEIKWNVKSYENELTEVVKYEIELMKVGDKYILTKFKPLN